MLCLWGMVEARRQLCGNGSFLPPLHRSGNGRYGFRLESSPVEPPVLRHFQRTGNGNPALPIPRLCTLAFYLTLGWLHFCSSLGFKASWRDSAWGKARGCNQTSRRQATSWSRAYSWEPQQLWPWGLGGGGGPLKLKLKDPVPHKTGQWRQKGIHLRTKNHTQVERSPHALYWVPRAEETCRLIYDY